MRAMLKILRKPKKPGNKGFTLIELLMVITILGVLGAIALSQFTLARTQGYNASAKSDLKNAFTAAQAFYTDNPSGTLDSTRLISYGFRGTNHVDLTIVDDKQDTLSMTAIYSMSGTQIYSIDSLGRITP